MKICDSWLREWIEHGLDASALAERLTMLGLEIESVTLVGAELEKVVVGRVFEVRRHPNADKLSLCRVDVGAGEPLGVVCGARNVREGGRYATALEGARLPNGMVIKPSKIRGEPSAGMLCSAAELGIEESAEGLLELDDDAAIGADAAHLLRLGDAVLDVNITPNRADCFSIAGIAREVAAAGGAELRALKIAAVPAAMPDTFPVSVPDPRDCPRFAGRVIRGLRADARTPLWMRERLRRCGVRPIHPVVDVTNYVMLELGQPMHAYDLARLNGGIAVRRGRAGEPLVLLDGREIQVDSDMLLIAHATGPIGLAGIMGGAGTGVSAATVDVFLESAYFTPQAIAGRGRRLGLHTDASIRFERGVDPSGQARAIERATQLILDIAGGRAGPVVDTAETDWLPVRAPVPLRKSRIVRVLGAGVPDAEVEPILRRLGMAVAPAADGWTATPPPARFDIEREEDLIEEVARVYGYGRIEAVPGQAATQPASIAETVDPRGTVRTMLVARGYQEVVTYSFIEPGIARVFGAADHPSLALSNPISTDMAVMRQSLWPGLVRAAQGNLHRQQDRVRLFELASRFTVNGAGEPVEVPCLAGVAVGSQLPEQWGEKGMAADVFDVKADLETLLAAGVGLPSIRFELATHTALHPGRSAKVVVAGRDAGWIGELHPAIARQFELPPVILFEVDAGVVLDRPSPRYQPISRYPLVRRDVAAVVARAVPAATLLDAVRAAAPGVLQDAFVFDIYTGPQVGEQEKSVAIGLILQDTSRTLTDEDADEVLRAVRASLKREFKARIRE